MAKPVARIAVRAVAVAAALAVAGGAGADVSKERRLAHRGGVKQVAFTPDGRRLVTTSCTTPGCVGLEIRVWDVATGEPIGRPGTGLGLGESLAVSPDGKTAATGGFDGFARLWDLAGVAPRGPAMA